MNMRGLHLQEKWHLKDLHRKKLKFSFDEGSNI